MGIFKGKRVVNPEDEAAYERVADSKKIKKLDKIYIIIACILAFSWLVWNFTGLGSLKISSVNLNFMSDYYANWKASSGQTILKTNLRFNSTVDKNYIYYYQPDTTGIYRMQRDGTQNSRLIGDNVIQFSISDGYIYYTDTKGVLKKAVPGGNPVTLLNKGQVTGFAKDGDYIYYTTFNNSLYTSNNGNSMELHRINIDGKNDKKIMDGSSSDFVSYGNYIYYTEVDMTEGIIGRIRKSGGQKEKIISLGNGYLEKIGIFKGWLYYAYDQTLYKCKLDGSDKTKVLDQVMDFSIENNILYVCTTKALNGQMLNQNDINFEFYSIGLDGRNKKVIDSENNPFFYLEDGIAMNSYFPSSNEFIDFKTGKHINMPDPQLNFAAEDLKDRIGEVNNSYRIGGNEPFGSQIIKNKNFIYYIGLNQSGICKMNEEDQKTYLIANKRAYKLDSLGNLLFFNGVDEKDNSLYLYCINDDGTGLEKAFDFPVVDFQVEKDGIYFMSNTQHLYKAQFADNRIVKVTDDSIQAFQIYDGYIYISCSNRNNNEIYRIKENGTSKEKLFGGQMSGFKISNGYIFFYGQDSYENNKVGLYKYKIGDKTPSLLAEAAPGFTVDNNYLYYKNEVTGEIFRVDFNGNNKLELNNSQYPEYFDGDTVYVNDAGGFRRMNLSDLAIKPGR